MSGRIALALILLLPTFGLAPPQAQERGPIPPGRVREGTLSFDGYATVGDFTGVTRSVTGQMAGGTSLAGVRGWVEAPVRTLKTGNGRRDRDLNKSLESDKYPTLRFELTGMSPAGPVGDSNVVTLHGRFVIHGVTRAVDLPATIVFRGSDAVLRSDFPLNLEEYRIGGLSKAFGMLKMDERIRVRVDLTFQLEREAGAGGERSRRPDPAEPGDHDDAGGGAAREPVGGVRDAQGEAGG